MVGDYSFYRAYMYDEELALLSKVHRLVKGQLTEQEITLISQIIKTYSKLHNFFNSDSTCPH